jgi:glyoxylase-like metal-dependent hydrolase (beta-lactamase superfamily II)/catechol 2,3-dioxygenase-like lactoylglutathione lyase family enzyme
VKAVLDHVGPAVTNLDETLAFFRDALGLEVAVSKEAPAPAGTADFTLRVDDIDAVLGDLRARGIRLLDNEPRRGNDGAMVALIDPTNAHGVLVELKQPAGTQQLHARQRQRVSETITLGDLELVILSDGLFRLDGGAMFGVVPKTFWEKTSPADDRNRIQMCMNPLLVRGARTMLIDAGCGDKMTAKQAGIYAFEREFNLRDSLEAAGESPESIEIVLATHLHFDHAGGFTSRGLDGVVRPRFPRAQYVVRRGEFEDAMHPNERTKGSYFLENYAPLADAGVLQLVDDDAAIMPGVRVRRTGGHTMHHQMVVIESGGKTAVFTADLLPTAAHLPDVWVMGYDLFPLDTMRFKHEFVREAIAREFLILLEHDPRIAAGYIREKDGKKYIEPVA